MKSNPKQGQLFLTEDKWEHALHMNVNPYGIWVPKQDKIENIIKSTLPPETPAMYIGTDGRPHVGVFLVGDIFYELPYNILKEINK